MVALTKTKRLDDEVLNVLKNMVWSDDGREMEITWQLDPKLYKKVKAVVENLGGIWNKKRKLHIFDTDPRPELFGIVEEKKLTIVRDGFFRTPEKVTRYIMGRMALGMADYTWLEPEAGDGAIVRVLLAEGYPRDRIYCIEQNPQRCEALRALGVRVANGDFLHYRHTSGVQFNRILMNPPFENGQDIEHVRKAYTHLADNGVMGAILGEGAFYRTDKKAVAFRAWLRTVGAYTEKLPDGSFHESGTDVSTRYIIIKR